ncbi:MAG: toxin-antitoxin system YwqK family antitoxin [Candidatus Entotheonellia bacterium]
MQFWEKFNNRTFPRACKCEAEGRYRYEGPFRKCVVPPSGGASARKLSEEERALRDGAEALLRKWGGDLLKAVRGFMALDPRQNPFSGVGSVLMEYGKTFSLVYKKLAEVRPQLELFTDNPMQEIADGLRKLSQELEASGTRMHEAFRGLPRDFQSVLQGDVQGRLQGDRLVTYYPNGAKRSETTYRSGREHGKRIEYYESGKKKSETDYSAGREHGKRVEWYESGEKHAETEYREGKRNGQAVQWCTNGRVELTATYRDDQEASRGATQPCQDTRTGTAVASMLFLIDVSGSSVATTSGRWRC